MGIESGFHNSALSDTQFTPEQVEALKAECAEEIRIANDPSGWMHTPEALAISVKGRAPIGYFFITNMENEEINGDQSGFRYYKPVAGVHRARFAQLVSIPQGPGDIHAIDLPEYLSIADTVDVPDTEDDFSYS